MSLGFPDGVSLGEIDTDGWIVGTLDGFKDLVGLPEGMLLGWIDIEGVSVVSFAFVGLLVWSTLGLADGTSGWPVEVMLLFVEVAASVGELDG